MDKIALQKLINDNNTVELEKLVKLEIIKKEKLPHQIYGENGILKYTHYMDVYSVLESEQCK